MRNVFGSLLAMAICAAVFLLTGGQARAGDCPLHRQTVVAAPVVVAPSVIVAQPQFFVVPSAPTVAIAPIVVAQPFTFAPFVVERTVVRQKFVQRRR